MIDSDANLDDEARAIAKLNGIPFKTALDYVWAIGDTPETDENRLTVIRNSHGVVIARIVRPTHEE